MKKDFFISYTRRDRAWAEWIAWQLENKGGYAVELDVWDWRAGDNFISKMHNAVENAESTLIVLTNAYFSSVYTEAEWTSVFAKAITGTGNRLIMVRVEDMQPPGLLASSLYIDLVGLDDTIASGQLLDGVASQKARPVREPAFPGISPRFPGTLPPVWNVPYRRNNNFTGREKILTHLDSTLQSRQTAALTQTSAITGLGGIGKTQAALEYVYRHLTDYEVIWWVHAETAQTLTNDYIAFAHKVNLPEKDAQEEQVIIDAVKQWLGKNRGWLFVYDNVEKPKVILSYLPQGQTGHILITSRHQKWGSLCTSIDITIWPRAESIEFLKTRTKHTDEAEMDTLADMLGDLPLALEQAAGYMTETDCSFSVYMKVFKSLLLELWKEESPPGDYPGTVATAWSLALEKIQSKAPAGVVIMNICSFLSSDGIPYSLVKSVDSGLPGDKTANLSDTLVFNKGIKALTHYSLITTQSQTILMHRLVQAVVRDNLAEKNEHEVWIKAVIKTVNKLFPSGGYNDPRCWPECSAMIAHARIVAEYGYMYKLAVEETTHLLKKIASYLHGRAQYEEAVLLCHKVLEISEQQLGPDHPDVAQSLNNLAVLLVDQGKYKEAESLYRRALGINEQQLGSDHIDVAACLNNLALLLWTQGKYEQAKPLYHRALGIHKQQLGPDHPDVAVCLNNLATLLKAQGKYEEAEPLYQRALEIYEKQLGPDHLYVAASLNNFAGLLHDQDKYKEAAPLYHRALEIYEKHLGPDHPTTKIIRENYQGLLDIIK